MYGGTPYDKQLRQLRNGVDIVVATPGRLDDLVERGACKLDDIEVVVLDEADHLCDLGFYPVVDGLMGRTPEGSQRLLLSATLDGDVDRLVRAHLRTPRLHELDANQGSVTTMEHHVMVVGGFRDKVDAVTRLVGANPRSIVFTRTREGATELAASMTAAGIEAVDLHGNLSQRVREKNLHRFSSGRAQVVVATDVAARGIHVDNVGLVVHYDTPADPKAYLHRSGRTARAGESGAVLTLTTPRQLDEVLRLQSRAGVTSRHHDLRTAPQPMTAEALATSGTSAPARRSGGQQGGRPGARSGAPRPAGGYRGGRDERTDRQTGRRDDRPRSGDRGPVRRSRDEDPRPAAGAARRAQREDRPSYGRDRRDEGAGPRRGAERSDRSGAAGRQSYVARPARAGSRPGAELPEPTYTKRRPRWSQPD